jgi:hypothetical protein
MSYEVKKGNIFGRIGSGVGKGLAEQVPKEIERSRLASGLEELSKNNNLSPFEQFTKLSSIPGITPQMIESGSHLLRQQGVSSALQEKANQENQQQSSPFPKTLNGQEGNEKQSPSITTRTPIEATLNPYIPKSFDQLQQRAGQLLTNNPALYAKDPDKAYQAAVQEDAQEQAISTALQGKRQKEQAVQNKVEEGLKEQNQLLGAHIPGNVYSEIEDKALNAVRSKEDGGEGLTEQEAKKKYGKELDAISRDYKAVETVGSWKLLSRSPSDNKAALRSLQTKFKERNDQENLADTFISKNSLSPNKAYYLAYPISDHKELNNEILKLPSLEAKPSFKKGYFEKEDPAKEKQNKSLEISEKLAPLLRKNGDASPLSIAAEIESRGYDPKVWMDYIDKNRKKLNLTERQARELDKPRDFKNTLDDAWMFSFSGLDKLLEQK